MTSVEGDARKELIRTALGAAWNDGDVTALKDLYSPDYVRKVFRTGATQSRDELIQSIPEIRAAFPDLAMTFDEMMCDGAVVVWGWRLTGTHLDTLFDLPPTYQPIDLSGVMISRFDGMHIQSDWTTSDSFDLLALQGIVSLTAAQAGPSDDGTGPDWGIDLDELKAVHRSYPTGVTVVTASVDGEPRGLVLNAFASVSLTPPLVMVAVNRTTATHEFLFRRNEFAINILAADQVPLADRFSRPIPSKFEGVEWSTNEAGVPLLDGVSARLEVEIVSRVTALTHTLFVARVTGTATSDRAPLIYLGGGFHDSVKLNPATTNTEHS